MIAFPVLCYFSVMTRPVNMAIHVSIPAVLDLVFLPNWSICLRMHDGGMEWI
jgi:hypothetical protein